MKSFSQRQPMRLLGKVHHATFNWHRRCSLECYYPVSCIILASWLPASFLLLSSFEWWAPPTFSSPHLLQAAPVFCTLPRLHARMMNPNMGSLRPGVILLRDGTDTSQVGRLTQQRASSAIALSYRTRMRLLSPTPPRRAAHSPTMLFFASNLAHHISGESPTY